MPHLSPCPGCQRHVRIDEHACPFCGGALPTTFRGASPPTLPARDLTRAALFAFTAAIAGCDDPGSTADIYGGPPAEQPAPPPQPQPQAQQQVPSTPQAQPLPADDPGATGEAYGAPPAPAEPPPPDPGTVGHIYGGPPGRRTQDESPPR